LPMFDSWRLLIPPFQMPYMCCPPSSTGIALALWRRWFGMKLLLCKVISTVGIWWFFVAACLPRSGLI
jgi:hypothetical protein